MPSLTEELMNLLTEYPKGEITENTVRKLSEGDQIEIARFFIETSSIWLGHMASKKEVGLFAYGFIIGHEWCRSRWSLW